MRGGQFPHFTGKQSRSFANAIGPVYRKVIQEQQPFHGQELHGHFRIEDAKWLTQPYEFDFVWYRDAPDEYAWPDVCDARDSRNTLK